MDRKLRKAIMKSKDVRKYMYLSIILLVIWLASSPLLFSLDIGIMGFYIYMLLLVAYIVALVLWCKKFKDKEKEYLKKYPQFRKIKIHTPESASNKVNQPKTYSDSKERADNNVKTNDAEPVSTSFGESLRDFANSPLGGAILSVAAGAAITKTSDKIVSNTIPTRNPNVDRYKKAQEEAKAARKERMEAQKIKKEKVGSYTLTTLPNGNQTLHDAGLRQVGHYDRGKNKTYYGNSYKEVGSGNLLMSLMK